MRHFCKTLLLIAVLSFYGFSEDWTLLFTGKDGNRVSADVDSIRWITPDTIEVWVETDLNAFSPIAEAEGGRMLRLVQYQRSRRVERTTYVVVYKRTGETFTSSKPQGERAEWTPIIPGSKGEYGFDAVFKLADSKK